MNKQAIAFLIDMRNQVVDSSYPLIRSQQIDKLEYYLERMYKKGYTDGQIDTTKSIQESLQPLRDRVDKELADLEAEDE